MLMVIPANPTPARHGNVSPRGRAHPNVGVTGAQHIILITHPHNCDVIGLDNNHNNVHIGMANMETHLHEWNDHVGIYIQARLRVLNRQSRTREQIMATRYDDWIADGTNDVFYNGEYVGSIYEYTGHNKCWVFVGELGRAGHKIANPWRIVACNRDDLMTIVGTYFNG